MQPESRIQHVISRCGATAGRRDSYKCNFEVPVTDCDEHDYIHMHIHKMYTQDIIVQTLGDFGFEINCLTLGYIGNYRTPHTWDMSTAAKFTLNYAVSPHSCT